MKSFLSVSVLASLSFLFAGNFAGLAIARVANIVDCDSSLLLANYTPPDNGSPDETGDAGTHMDC